MGDSFTALANGGKRSGAFSSETLSGFGSGAFNGIYGGNSVSLLVTQTVGAVPEPQTCALLLAALVAVGSVVWRRQAGTA